MRRPSARNRRRAVVRNPRRPRNSPRGSVVWPLLAALAVVVCGLALIAVGSSPSQVRRCCDVIDMVVTQTVDTWLGVDTMQVPGLRPEDLPAHGFFADLMLSTGVISPAPPRGPPAAADAGPAPAAADP